MADTKISLMTVASSLTGTELIPIVQGGVNKSVTPNIVWSNAVGIPPITGISGWPANSSGTLTNDGIGNLSWLSASGAFWPLSGTGTLTGISTITSNTNSQHIFNGAWTANGDNQFHIRLTGTFTANNVASTEHITGLQIDPTLISGANNQTLSALYINPTFTDAFTSTLKSAILIGNQGIGSTDAGLVIARAIAVSTGSGSAHGFGDNSVVTRSGTIGYAAFDDKVTMASNTFDHHAGFQFRVNTSSTVNNIYGFTAIPTISGSFTNYIGFYQGTVGTTGTNVYGSWIDDMGSSYQSSYAYFATKQRSSFGGGILIPQVAQTSNWGAALNITPATHTGLTVSTEFNPIIINAHTVTYAGAGTVPFIRTAYIQAQTIASSAPTNQVTTAIGLAVETPVAGSNTGFTNVYASVFGTATGAGNIGVYTAGGGIISRYAFVNSTGVLQGAVRYIGSTAELQMWNGAGQDFTWISNATEIARMTAAGKLGLGLSPTALLHLKAGTATANTAPLKFTSGTNLTTAETGAVEYNGTNLFFTRTGTTRENVLVGNDVASAPATNTIGTIVDYYGSSSTRVLTTPNSWASVVIGGTTYKIPLYT